MRGIFILLIPVFFLAGCYAALRTPPLYLLEYVEPPEREAFADAVRAAARNLHTSPDWLMAVMYQESLLRPDAVNLAGSKACGLIQFMPFTIEELNLPADVCALPAAAQMPYVQAYLEQYAPFESLTDLYLSILYPAARNQGAEHVLFRRGSIAYKQNRGLDVDDDGRVTVGDITEMLMQKFPELY